MSDAPIFETLGGSIFDDRGGRPFFPHDEEADRFLPQDRRAVIARVTAGMLAPLIKDRDQGKLTQEQLERSAARLAPQIREACAEALAPKAVERCVTCGCVADTIKGGLPYCSEHAALVPRPALPTGMSFASADISILLRIAREDELSKSVAVMHRQWLSAVKA